MDNFEAAYDYMISRECNGDEVSDNPFDTGGITKYGISLRFLRSIDLDKLATYGIYSTEPDEIINLRPEQAKALYKGEFWNHARFDQINGTNNRNYIFDMSINLGIAPAIKCAQRACWSVMHSRSKLIDDGILGDDTISLINQCGFFLLPAMRSERAGYYRMIVEHNPAQKDFLQGWLNRAYGV